MKSFSPAGFGRMCKDYFNILQSFILFQFHPRPISTTTDFGHAGFWTLIFFSDRI